MKVSEQQIRTASLIALAIGASTCIAFAFLWLDGALLKHPSAIARFLVAYLILAVAAVISRGRVITGIVLAVSLVVSWLGIATYLCHFHNPLIFDGPARLTWIKQCLLAIPSLFFVAASSFVRRHRHETNVA